MARYKARVADVEVVEYSLATFVVILQNKVLLGGVVLSKTYA